MPFDASLATAKGKLRTPRELRTGMQREQKITLGEMRSNGGPRLLIVYCADFKCSHSVIVSSELWPNHVLLSDLGADIHL